MSDSDRRNRVAYFLRGYWSDNPISWWDISRVIVSITVTAVALWIFLGAFLGLWGWLLDNRKAAEEYQQRAQKHRYEAAQQIAERCNVPLAPAEFIGMCLADQVRAYREENASYEDLDAQQEMARWTAVMGIVGVIGVPLSILGLLALYFSLRQTRLAISTDREVGHAQVRAYLTAEPKVPTVLEADKIARCEVHIKNTGQSPAFHVKYIAAILLEDHPVKPEGGPLIYPDSNQPVRNGSTVASSGDFFAEARSRNPIAKDDLNSAMKSDNKKFYVSCIVYYKDVFGVDRETMMTAYLDQTGDPITDPSTGRVRRAYAWMISDALNHAT